MNTRNTFAKDMYVLVGSCSVRVFLLMCPLHSPYVQYDYSQNMGYAAPGMMQPQQPYSGQIFQPTPAFTPTAAQSMYGSSFDDEPPLLEGTRAHTVLPWSTRHAIFSGNTLINLVFIPSLNQMEVVNDNSFAFWKVWWTESTENV